MSFDPDWAVPPGDTLREALAERGMSQQDLADLTGYTQKHINWLINARVGLSADCALRLEQALGISARFWLHRDADYRLAVARIAAARGLK